MPLLLLRNSNEVMCSVFIFIFFEDLLSRFVHHFAAEIKIIKMKATYDHKEIDREST